MQKKEAKARINELQLLKNSVGDFCPQSVRDYITDRIAGIIATELRKQGKIVVEAKV